MERAPTTGKYHYQGFIELKNPARLPAVKKLIGGNPHIEICRAKAAAIDYCRKSETRQFGPYEHGTPSRVQDRQNSVRASSMVALWEKVKAGRKFKDMIEEDPNTARYDRQVKSMKFALQESNSNRQEKGVKVWCFYGPTDLGKTWSAINVFCHDTDYYILEPPTTKGGKLWFDGYEGERTLILDDFKDTFCSLESLKRMLDKYKYKVEVKGGMCWAVWDRVIITSNYAPCDWYKKWDGSARDDLAPLQRRINEIRLFIDRGIWQKQDFDKNNIGDVCPIVDEDRKPDTPILPLPLDEEGEIPPPPPYEAPPPPPDRVAPPPPQQEQEDDDPELTYIMDHLHEYRPDGIPWDIDTPSESSSDSEDNDIDTLYSTQQRTSMQNLWNLFDGDKHV